MPHRALLVSLSLAMLSAACVGDTPGGTTGQTGGPCFSNGTCNAGLTCASGTCIVNDAGSADGTLPTDGAADASVDTQNDPNNCGSVGRACPSKQCKNGDCVRRVFVTSGTNKGTFGGASGGDNLCQISAEGPALKGTYYAWVSTSSSSPKTHFVKGTAPYVLTDGTTVVANDFAGLIGAASTPLLHGIDTDESGIQRSGVNVWTATHPDGTEAGPPDCSDFDTMPSDANATIGTSGMTSPSWTEATTLACSTFAHMYCVEQ